MTDQNLGIGPGSQLVRIMPSLAKLYSFITDHTCGCKEYSALMDIWGIAGCERRREEIVNRLVDKAPSVLKEFACVRTRAEQLVDQAIEEAKKASPHLCHCGRVGNVDESGKCYWCANKRKLAEKAGIKHPPQNEPDVGHRNASPLSDIDLITGIKAAVCSKLDQVTIVTTHFNPCGYERAKQTYYEWLPTLGSLAVSLRCYELVFDDDAPEIHGSVVIRGSRSQNLMWQKEALINRALRDTDPSVKYFVWLDHDIVLSDPDWLSKGMAMIDGGAVSAQLFDHVDFLNLEGEVIRTNAGAVSQWITSKQVNGSPGGAWIADRKYLDSIGGLNNNNVVGGGDQAFYFSQIGRLSGYTRQYGPVMSDSQRNWTQATSDARNGRSCGLLRTKAYHLWHGENKDRQYQDRNLILADGEFDPALDVIINSDGILEWSSNKPSMHAAVRSFFEARKEDGS